MGIVKALQEWRHYIQGSPFTTTVLSDHKNLTYFRKPQKLDDRQAQWSLVLSEYDIELVHTLGTKMIQSDVISRRPDLNPGLQDDNHAPEVMLKPELFVWMIDTVMQEQIESSKKTETDIIKALEILKDADVRDLNTDLQDWIIKKTEKGQAIFYRGRQYVPDDIKF